MQGHLIAAGLREMRGWKGVRGGGGGRPGAWAHWCDTFSLPSEENNARASHCCRLEENERVEGEGGGHLGHGLTDAIDAFQQLMWLGSGNDGGSRANERLIYSVPWRL